MLGEVGVAGCGKDELVEELVDVVVGDMAEKTTSEWGEVGADGRVKEGIRGGTEEIGEVWVGEAMEEVVEMEGNNSA